jgi:hypothetical protein
MISYTPPLMMTRIKGRSGMFRVATPNQSTGYSRGLSCNYGELAEPEVRELLTGHFETAEIEEWIMRAKASPAV